MPALRRSLLVCVLLAPLIGCQNDGPLGNAESSEQIGATDAQILCERTGGRWAPSGAETTFTCFRDTRDANQSCSSASDCEGLCLARSRTCSPVKPFLGCHETLTEAGLPATLCVN